MCDLPLTHAIDMENDEVDGFLFDFADGVHQSIPAHVQVPPIPPLARAIQYDDVTTLAAILSHTPERANTDTFHDVTPLMMVCRSKNLTILNMLINAGADVTVRNSLGQTALHAAATEHWVEGAKVLINNGASVNAICSPTYSLGGLFRESPLHHAIRTADEDMVFLMLGREKEINCHNSKDSNADTPNASRLATHSDRTGSPIWNAGYNKTNKLGTRAPPIGNIKKDDDASTPKKRREPADLTIKDGNNRSVVHLAAMSRSKAILDIILSYKECENLVLTKDIKEKTPLHMLFWDVDESPDEYAIIECVDILLGYDIDINAETIKGHTALFLAITRKLSEVVLYLLGKEAKPLIVTEDGWSTVHAACSAGSYRCLKHLLDTGLVGDLVFKETNNGMTPFHLATCSYSWSCIKMLLKNGGDHLTNCDSSGTTRFSLLNNNIPSSKQLLEEIFDDQISESKEGEHEADYAVSFDYSVLLEPDSDIVQCSLISELTTVSNMETLLLHPLLGSFLYQKWNRIRPFFYTNFVIYFIFCLLHTFYVSHTFGQDAKDWSNSIMMLNTCRALHVVLFLLILIPDMIFLIANFRKYFQQWETYIKLIALSASAFIIFSKNVEKGVAKDMEVERHVAAVSAFFTWAGMMMLVGRFPVLGVYILMFTKTARSIIVFLLAFSSLLIGFAIAFQVLFININDFRSFPSSFVKTLMMMIGEIDYGNIVEEGGMSNTLLGYVFLVVFLFLVPILMANLLIGLAVSDLPDLNRQGIMRRLSKQASYLTAYELLIKFFKENRCFPRFVRFALAKRCEIEKKITFKPNTRHFNENSAWRLWSEKMPIDTLKAASEVVKKVKERPLEVEEEKKKTEMPKSSTMSSMSKTKFLRSISGVSKHSSNPDSDSYQRLLENYQNFVKDYRRDFKNLKIYIRSHMIEPSASPKVCRLRPTTAQKPQEQQKTNVVETPIKEKNNGTVAFIKSDEATDALTARITQLETIIQEQSKSIENLANYLKKE